MRTIYLESFEKDIKKIKEKDVKTTLLNLLKQIKESDSIIEMFPKTPLTFN